MFAVFYVMLFSFMKPVSKQTSAAKLNNRLQAKNFSEHTSRLHLMFSKTILYLYLWKIHIGTILLCFIL